MPPYEQQIIYAIGKRWRGQLFLSRPRVDPYPTKGAELMRKITEKSEINRLSRIYKGLPPNQMKVVEGLIVEAARLRVRLDYLWQDLQENGETELFTQSEKTEPYERERPQSRTYTATNKSYQAIIKQLSDLCPPSEEDDPLAEFR